MWYSFWRSSKRYVVPDPDGHQPPLVILASLYVLLESPLPENTESGNAVVLWSSGLVHILPAVRGKNNGELLFRCATFQPCWMKHINAVRTLCDNKFVCIDRIFTAHIWNPGTCGWYRRFKMNTTGCSAWLCIITYQVPSGNLSSAPQLSKLNNIAINFFKSQVLTQPFLTFLIPVFFNDFPPNWTIFYFNVPLVRACQSNIAS